MSEEVRLGTLFAFALIAGIGAIVGGCLAHQYRADNHELRELLEWWRDKANDNANLANEARADLAELKTKLAKFKDDFDSI